jgi:hypothetical protein
MPNTTQFPTNHFEFGIDDADAPTMAGYKFHTADLAYEGEVFAQAQDGEGHTVAVVASNPNKRNINGTFTGYIVGGADPAGANTATVEFMGFTFIVKSVKVGKKKGDFWEASVDATYFPGVVI